MALLTAEKVACEFESVPLRQTVIVTGVAETGNQQAVLLGDPRLTNVPRARKFYEDVFGLTPG